MFDLSPDRFRFDLGNRSFLLTDIQIVWIVLVSSLVLSRALVVLIMQFDTAVITLSSMMCYGTGTSDCVSGIKTPIDSLTAGLHWNGGLYTVAPNPDGPTGLIQALCRADCGWYAHAWTHGYDMQWHPNGQVVWPWFPLFPLIIAIVAYWWPSLAIEYAVLINHIFLLATSWLLYLLTRYLTGSRTVGLTAAILFIVSPMSVYSSVPLAESVANLLSIGAVYAAYRGRWLVCGFAMALASASRPHWLLIVLPVLIIAMRQVGFREFFQVYKHIRIWFALALAPVGICLHSLYLYSIVGDALAFSNVQVAWSRSMEDWPINYYDHFKWYWDIGFFWRPIFLASAGIIGLCTAGYLAVRKFFPEAIFLGVIAILTVGTSLGSLPRYLLALWPTYLALALILRNKPRTTVTLAIVFLALLPIYTIAWISWHVWVG